MSEKNLRRRLGRWRRALERFLSDAELRDGLYECRLVDGRRKKVPAESVAYWRYQLVRLEQEADRRAQMRDADWFFWLDEYASMVAGTIHDDFDESYAPAVEQAARSQRQRRQASLTGGAAKREASKQRAILTELSKYPASDRTAAGKVARKLKVTADYVRSVRRKKKKPT